MYSKAGGTGSADPELGGRGCLSGRARVLVFSMILIPPPHTHTQPNEADFFPGDGKAASCFITAFSKVVTIIIIMKCVVFKP